MLLQKVEELILNAGDIKGKDKYAIDGTPEFKLVVSFEKRQVVTINHTVTMICDEAKIERDEWNYASLSLKYKDMSVACICIANIEELEIV